MTKLDPGPPGSTVCPSPLHWPAPHPAPGTSESLERHRDLSGGPPVSRAWWGPVCAPQSRASALQHTRARRPHRRLLVWVGLSVEQVGEGKGKGLLPSRVSRCWELRPTSGVPVQLGVLHGDPTAGADLSCQPR